MQRPRAGGDSGCVGSLCGWSSVRKGESDRIWRQGLDHDYLCPGLLEKSSRGADIERALKIGLNLLSREGRERSMWPREQTAKNTRYVVWCDCGLGPCHPSRA